MKLVNQAIAEAATSLDLGLFYDAVFRSEFAVYVLRFDADGTARFEDANQTVIRMADKPLERIIGRRPTECLSVEIGECLESQLAKCFASGETLFYERSSDGPNGMLAFRTSLVPIKGRFGGVEHVIGITRDVSNEADLARDAAQNAAMLQRVGIALPSAIYILDLRTGTIRFIGRDADPERQKWRGGAEQAGEAAVAQFFHPDDHQKAVDHLKHLAALPDGEVSTIEFRILSQSGEFRPHVNRETVLSRNAAGEVEYILGVSEDITERDRAERQVRDLSKQLLTSQIDERRRIAEDLHDSTGQHLFAVGLALSRARSTQVTGGNNFDNRAVLVEALDDARHSLQIAQREVRMLSYLLHPPEIASDGLSEAIRTFARGFGRRSGHYVEVNLHPEADNLNDEVSLNLFRACQEALTNVYRHADASQAVIRLEIDDAEVRLEVADDGRGVDPSQTVVGVGLSGMQERMQWLGGDALLSSSPQGATLLVTVPRAKALGTRRTGRLSTSSRK